MSEARPQGAQLGGSGVVQVSGGLRVWDLPTRLFHWGLLCCVAGAVITAYMEQLEWHMRFGQGVVTLLLFRLVWGVVGGHWSRFPSFSYGPLTIFRYLRWQRQASQHWDAGHSPLGAMSVWAMLWLLLAQVLTGMVADDEIATTGPLIRFVSGAISSGATTWHKAYGQYIIYFLVAMHVTALIVYARRGKRLVGAMISGDKPRQMLAPDTPASLDGWPQRFLGLLVFYVALVAIRHLWLWGENSAYSLSALPVSAWLWPF